MRLAHVTLVVAFTLASLATGAQTTTEIRPSQQDLDRMAVLGRMKLLPPPATGQQVTPQEVVPQDDRLREATQQAARDAAAKYRQWQTYCDAIRNPPDPSLVRIEPQCTSHGF